MKFLTKLYVEMDVVDAETASHLTDRLVALLDKQDNVDSVVADDPEEPEEV